MDDVIKYNGEIIDKTFAINNKIEFVGQTNELLICGNLHKQLGLNAKVLHNYNYNYDIEIDNTDNTKEFLECKFDNNVSHTNNFYFEIYDMKNQCLTGVYNKDMEIYYSHTFKENGVYKMLYAKRKVFDTTLKKMATMYRQNKDIIRLFINNRNQNKALLVDKDIFISHFKGNIMTLQPIFRW